MATTVLPVRVLKRKFEALFGSGNSNLSKSVSMFQSWIEILYSRSHQTIAAGNISLAKVISVFGLSYNPEPSYELGQSDPYTWTLNSEGTSRPHTTWLKPALQAAGRRMATRYSEASCRFIIELILLDRMETLDAQNPLRTVNEVDSEYIIEDPATPGKMLRISGRADLCVAYSTEKLFAAHTCLIVLEAKPNASNGLAQLLSYLSIVQRRREQAEKTNVTVYGILTNAIEWRFVRLGGKTRHVSISRQYDPRFANDERNIQDFLGEILDAASRSSPTTTPITTSLPPFPDSSYSNPEVIDFINVVEAERFRFSEPCPVTRELKRYGDGGFIVLDEEGMPQEGIPHDTMMDVIED